MSEVTQILDAINQGDAEAPERLLTVVYDELRRIASAKLSGETPGQTLQATALVHETYLRLLGSAEDTPDSSSSQNWQSRGHFFAAAAEAMRRILIENARRKKRLKRGGDRDRIALEDVEPAEHSPPIDLLALDEALKKLETEDELKAQVVKLRYFAGLTIEQTAEALKVSEPTVKRHWYYARAWLRREIGKGEE